MTVISRIGATTVRDLGDWITFYNAQVYVPQAPTNNNGQIFYLRFGGSNASSDTPPSYYGGPTPSIGIFTFEGIIGWNWISHFGEWSAFSWTTDTFGNNTGGGLTAGTSAVTVFPGQSLTFQLSLSTDGASYAFGFLELPSTIQTFGVGADKLASIYFGFDQQYPDSLTTKYLPNQHSTIATLQGLATLNIDEKTFDPFFSQFFWQGFSTNAINGNQDIQKNNSKFIFSYDQAGLFIPTSQNLSIQITENSNTLIDLTIELDETDIIPIVASQPSFGIINFSAQSFGNFDHATIGYNPNQGFVGTDVIGYYVYNTSFALGKRINSFTSFINIGIGALATPPPPPPGSPPTTTPPPPPPGSPPTSPPPAPAPFTPPPLPPPLTIQIVSFGTGVGNKGITAGQSSFSIMGYQDIQSQLSDLPNTFTRTGQSFAQLVDAETSKLAYYTQTQGDIVNQTDFAKATDGWLDVWGTIIDIPRRPDESDFVYKPRLRNMVAAVHATPNAIIDWIKNVELLNTVEIEETFPNFGYQIILPYNATNDQVISIIRTLAWVRPAGVPFSIQLKGGGTFLDTVNYFNAPKVTGAYLATSASPFTVTIPQSTNNQEPIFPDLFFSDPTLNPNTVANDTIPTITTTVNPDTTVQSSINILGHMAAQQGLLTDYNIGSQVRTITEAASSVVEIEGAAIQSIVNSSLLYSGMSLFGIYPQPATPSSGIASFFAGSPTFTVPVAQEVPIPAGTVIATAGGLQFITTASATLTRGSATVDVPVQCSIVGVVGNIPVQSLSSILSIMSYPLHVINKLAFTNGSNTESVASARARLFAELDSLDRATPVTIAQDVIGLSLPDGSEKIAYATVVEPWNYLNQTTTVGFTLYIDNGNGGASTDLQQVALEWLNGNVSNPVGGRPAGVPFSVQSVTPVFVILSISGQILPQTNPTIVQIYLQNAIISYFNKLQFGETAYESELDAAIANGTLGLLTALSISLFFQAVPNQEVTSVQCSAPFQRVVLAPNGATINIAYDGFNTTTFTFSQTAPPPPPPIIIGTPPPIPPGPPSPPAVPPPGPPILPPPSSPPPGPGTSNSNLLLQCCIYNLAPWIAGTAVAPAVSQSMYVNTDPFGNRTTIYSLTWPASRETLNQALPLALSTNYTASIYARTDINLLSSPATLNVSPWTRSGANPPTVATSTFTNPINSASDVSQFTFTGGTGGPGRGTIQQSFTATASTQYTMAVWAQGTSLGGSFYLAYYNGSSTITQISATPIIPPTGRWTQYQFTFTTGLTDTAPTWVIVNSPSDLGTAVAGTIAFYGATVFPTNSTSTFFLGYFNGSSAITQITAPINPANNVWTRYSLPFTTGSSVTTDSKPQLVFVNDGSDTGTAFAGTVSLFAGKVELGTVATPWTGCAIPPAPTANPITITATTAVTTSIFVSQYNSSEQIDSVTITTAPTNGTAAVSGLTTINYTSTAGFTGVVTLKYTVTNAGGTSAPAQISITVSAVVVGGLGYMVGLTGGAVGSESAAESMSGRIMDVACTGFIQFSGFVFGPYPSSNGHNLLTNTIFAPVAAGGVSGTQTSFTTALAGTADWTNQSLGYNSLYYSLANDMKRNNVMSVRPLHEAGGTWYPWNTAIGGANYQKLFKLIAQICRSVIPGVIIEFNGNIQFNPVSVQVGSVSMVVDGVTRFPGKYDPVTNPGGCDVVSSDWYTHNYGSSWNDILTVSFGYQFYHDLAVANNVGLCMSEVACDKPSTDSTTFMRDMINWINALPPGLFRYFIWSPWADIHIYTLGTDPNAQAQIKAAWGGTKFGGSWWTGTPLPPSDF